MFPSIDYVVFELAEWYAVWEQAIAVTTNLALITGSTFFSWILYTRSTQLFV